MIAFIFPMDGSARHIPSHHQVTVVGAADVDDITRPPIHAA